MTAEVEKVGLRIERVALRRVRVPLLEPFRISNGSAAEKDAVLVEVRTAEGVTGWGEASPMSGSFYSSDTPDGAWRVLRETLVPAVLGAGEIDARQFHLRLRGVACGPFAKAGIEGALWDAHAGSVGVPLCELLGGRAQPPLVVASGVAVGIYDTVEELLERVGRYVREGYRRAKIKIQPGWDVGPVAAVRERFPAVPLMVDANAAYTLADAEVFRELDGYGLMMIEQPLAREAHAESAALQKQLRTPLCADESAESPGALEEIIRLGSARVVNIKVQRVGGLSEALLMLGRAREAGLGCWVGTMPELGVASAQGLHFAALGGFDYPTDIEASARWYADDIVEPAIAIDAEGFIHIPEGAGTGYAVSRERVEHYTVAAEEFTA